jgi:membrane protease YdiL (CAAX protease family)
MNGVGERTSDNGRSRFAVLLFVLGMAVMFAAFYSQYFIHGLGAVFSTLVVYGVPFVVATLLRGRVIAGSAFRHTGVAFKFGVSSFGLFALLGGLVGMVVLYALGHFYPALDLSLGRHNPVLDVPPEFAWFMVGISIVVVGPVEEYLFRGFVYGGMLGLFRQHHWLSLALLSSFFFAVAHLYYAMVYGFASLLAFIDLMAFGMAMSFTYYFSGGNLFIPALIHGLYDAAGFLAVAVSPAVGGACRGAMVLVGIVIAVVLAVRSLKSAIST